MYFKIDSNSIYIYIKKRMIESIMNKENMTGSQNDTYVSEPRVYELGFHILPTVNEEDLGTERDALVAFITDLGGIVVSEEQAQLINLAYPMDKVINNKRNIFNQAYFGWIKFTLTGEGAESLKDQVDAQAAVLRSLIIKTVKENTIYSENPFKTATNSDYADVEFEEEIATEEVSEEVVSEESEEVSTDADDLTKIEGLGPKIAELFVANGIATFADLSASKVGDLRTLLADNSLAAHDPKTWSKQATLAKNGKWDKLAELQEELDGGKAE